MRKLITILAVTFLVAACTPEGVASYLKIRAEQEAIEVQHDAGYDFLIAAANLHNEPFLVCTRAHESDTAGGYLAYNPNGPWYGAYQYLQNTWNWAAGHYGASQYVGVDPRQVPGYFQDLVTFFYYKAGGNGPWGGRC